jgi:endoglucanase
MSIRGAFLLTAAFWWAAATIANPEQANGFFHSQGTQIIDPDGNPFIAKGMIVSNWLLPEAYALNLEQVHTRYLDSPKSIHENIVRLLDGDEDLAHQFWDLYRTNYFTKDDVREFARMGFNALRLPFNYRLLSPEDEPDVFLEEGFQLMDQVIGWCKEVGMSVLLDMHACPGGQNHEPHSDPEYSYWRDEYGEWKERGVQVLFENNTEYFEQTGRTTTFNKERTARIWREIADRYKDEPAILGYELVNEPYYYYTVNTDHELRDTFIHIINRVREVDNKHICFVSGNIFAEMIDGLLPPFDDNMGIGFHRYWRETGFADGKVQEYLDAREEHQIPFLLTESGENSNTWIYEMKELMASLDIGWFFWGFKKNHEVARGYKVETTEDYQYVIDNWRGSETDSARVWKGLMDLAESVKTENCRVAPGYFEAMQDPMYNIKSKPYDPENIPVLPGVVQAVHYDVGNQGVAYSDTRYKNEEYQGTGWNLGWIYRSDGVDIAENNDAEELIGIGYNVYETETGEWLKYTVNVTQRGCFRASFRVKTKSEAKIQLLTLTEEINIPNTAGTWQTIEYEPEFQLQDGLKTIVLQFLGLGVDMNWILFQEAVCQMQDYPGGFLESKSYDPENIPVLPGVVHAVHYDFGNEGMAYSDTRYKNGEYQGAGLNLAWNFHSDGIDIEGNDDIEEPIGIGYNVYNMEAGEWLKYTVNVTQKGCFRVSFRLKTKTEAKIQLLTLTKEINIPNTASTWQTVKYQPEFQLQGGLEMIFLKFLEPGVGINWMFFQEAVCQKQNYPGDFHIPGPRGSFKPPPVAVLRSTEKSGTTRSSAMVGTVPLFLSLILSIVFAAAGN